MSISIDVNETRQKNKTRIIEIKALIIQLKRQIRALETELQRLLHVNVFLEDEKALQKEEEVIK